MNPPIVIISFLFCIKNLIESKSHEHGDKVDWLGFALLAVALPSLIFATTQGDGLGWTSWQVILLYMVAIVSIIIFYFVEKRVESPIINFSLFANPLFVSGASANFALAFFYTTAFFLMPLYLHNVVGQRAFEIGLTLLPTSAMVAILSPAVGTLVDKYGPKVLLTFGFILLGISAYMQTQFSAQTHLSYILITFAIFGVGWAFILSPSFIAALSSVPTSISGVAMGSLGTLHNFGGAIGLAIGTVIYHYQAYQALLVDVYHYKLTKGSWMDNAIADPDNSVHIIEQASGLSESQATTVFHNAFLAGYSSTMWLLIGISVLTLGVVLVGLKKPKQ